MVSKRIIAAIGIVGQILIAAGLLILSFAAFQLWGTSYTEQKAQSDLEEQLERQLANTKAETTASDDESRPDDKTTSAEGPAPALEPDQVPKLGQPFGKIKIPSIDLEKTIVEGVQRDDLRQAPGHYPDTPLPGQAGNASIAGHRTTYGQPFHDLDKLVPGDTIEVETLQGVFMYRVEGQPSADPASSEMLGHQIVLPTDVDVIADRGDNRLTLTACHPKFSAKERIVVTAVLEAEPAPPTPKVETVEAEPVSFEDSLGWQPEEAQPTILWALITAGIFAIAWLCGRIWRRLFAYGLASPLFIAALLVCFTHLDKLIPAV